MNAAAGDERGCLVDCGDVVVLGSGGGGGGDGGGEEGGTASKGTAAEVMGERGEERGSSSAENGGGGGGNNECRRKVTTAASSPQQLVGVYSDRVLAFVRGEEEAKQQNRELYAAACSLLASGIRWCEIPTYQVESSGRFLAGKIAEVRGGGKPLRYWRPGPGQACSREDIRLVTEASAVGGSQEVRVQWLPQEVAVESHYILDVVGDGGGGDDDEEEEKVRSIPPFSLCLSVSLSLSLPISLSLSLSPPPLFS
jgi:hypothetical protein